MRGYAKETEVKVGIQVDLDGGFTCVEACRTTIHKDEHGLYFECSEGKHYLDGQLEDGEYIGLSIPT